MYTIGNSPSTNGYLLINRYTSFSYAFNFIFVWFCTENFFLGINFTGGSDVPKNINCHFFNNPIKKKDSKIIYVLITLYLVLFVYHHITIFI